MNRNEKMLSDAFKRQGEKIHRLLSRVPTLGTETMKKLNRTENQERKAEG